MTSGHPLSAWRTLLRSYPCPTCGAHPGDPCTTNTGREAGLEHAARRRLTGRCSRCGALFDVAKALGTLCPRCQLVRDLEVERATTWKRRNQP